MTEALAELRVEKACALLAECRTVDEAKDIADQAEAMRVYMRRQKASLAAQADAWEIAQHANRRLGQLSAALPQARPGRPAKGEIGNSPLPISKKDALADLGVSKMQASRWERLADLPDDEFAKRLGLGRARIEKRSATGQELAATSSGGEYDGDEWYTPAVYVEAAREVMGGIELDPASNKRAQKTVKADRFLTKLHDALQHEWEARSAFLNPPYSNPLIKHFIDKLLEEFEAGRTKQAIVLVNNQTETAWFQKLLERFPACFPKGRIAFEAPADTKADDPRQGQTFFYLGPDVASFVDVFSQFGQVVVPAERAHEG